MAIPTKAGALGTVYPVTSTTPTQVVSSVKQTAPSETTVGRSATLHEYDHFYRKFNDEMRQREGLVENLKKRIHVLATEAPVLKSQIEDWKKKLQGVSAHFQTASNMKKNI